MWSKTRNKKPILPLSTWPNAGELVPRAAARPCRAIGVAAVVLGIALGTAAWHQPAASRPHGVILWVIDTCRADRLSVYGSERRTTPFLERIAAQGAVFEHAFAQAPWTKPSMAALLGGRHPGALGIRGLLDRLDDAVVTLPEALAGTDYARVGFSTNPIVGRLSNYQQGFDQFVESATILNAGFIDRVASGSAAAINRQVLPWLTANAQRPFFLFIQSVDPHEEYRPAREYLEQFADPAGEGRYRAEWQALKHTQPQQLSNHCTMGTFTAAGVDPEWFIDYGRRLYDADILAHDAAMAELWRHLERLGIADQVLLLVTADHGEEFLEHGSTSHGYSLYNQSLHVPLILRAPGLIPPGVRISAPVRLIDIYPTLLDLLGVAAPPGLEGESLVPLLRGAMPTAPRPIFAQKEQPPDTSLGQYHIGDGVSLIRWPWKLTLNARSPAGVELPARELYDLAQDPGESSNLAASNTERVRTMEAELVAWRARMPAGAPRSTGSPITPSAEVIERLRELGYAE